MPVIDQIFTCSISDQGVWNKILTKVGESMDDSQLINTYCLLIGYATSWKRPKMAVYMYIPATSSLFKQKSSSYKLENTCRRCSSAAAKADPLHCREAVLSSWEISTAISSGGLAWLHCCKGSGARLPALPGFDRTSNKAFKTGRSFRSWTDLQLTTCAQSQQLISSLKI